MISRRTLNIFALSLLLISNICVASDSKYYYKNSINDCNGNITLMSRNGHENDVLFPQENNNNECTNQKQSLYIEFNNDSSYKVIYDNKVNIDTSNINLLPLLLEQYIKVKSIQKKIEKERNVLDDFTVACIDCKKIIFNDIKSGSDNFDLVITNNSGETLGVVFNLSDDTKFGNIHLNNIKSLNVNTVSSNTDYKFTYKKLSSNKDSTLRIFMRNKHEKVCHISGK